MTISVRLAIAHWIVELFWIVVILLLLPVLPMSAFILFCMLIARTFDGASVRDDEESANIYANWGL